MQKKKLLCKTSCQTVIEIHKTPIIWRISARSKVITAETGINHSRLEDPKRITNKIIVESSLEDNFNFLQVKTH